MDKEKLYQYLLLLGDNPMILGQRLGEYCGHGPELETDMALTNISLDLFGQVRNYFQYAASLLGKEKTEDEVAMMRLEHEYRNVMLVEQPNTDFAFIICRQFLFDTYHRLLLKELVNSNDEMIASVANKSIKEVEYHVDFSSSWMRRLGGGTEISKEKVQYALNELWQFAMELLGETEIEKEAKEVGIGADLIKLKPLYFTEVTEVIEASGLSLPENVVQQSGGKNGHHTEYLGYILADFQFMQRAYPNMKW